MHLAAIPHIKATPVGELVRTKKACSDPESQGKQVVEVDERLSAWGFPTWSLTRAHNRVKNRSRTSLIHNSDLSGEKLKIPVVSLFQSLTA